MAERMKPMIKPANRVTKRLVQFVANVTPHCNDVTRLLSESMERRLPLGARLLIRLHFTICVWCKRYGEQLKFLRDVSSGLPERGCDHGRESLPSSARERLHKTLEKAGKGL